MMHLMAEALTTWRRPGLKSMKNNRQVTPAERRFLSAVGQGSVKTFDNLPEHVQVWLAARQKNKVSNA